MTTRGHDVKRRREAIKSALKSSGHTYDDVARLANVTWRMVKYWIDGQRTSAPIARAFETLTKERATP